MATQAAHLHRTAARYHAIGWRFAADEHNEDAFTPLSAGAAHMNQMLKRARAPQGIFNPGKLYA